MWLVVVVVSSQLYLFVVTQFQMNEVSNVSPSKEKKKKKGVYVISLIVGRFYFTRFMLKFVLFIYLFKRYKKKRNRRRRRGA